MATEWLSMSLREAGVSLIDCEHRTPPAAEFGYPYVGIPQVKDGRINLNGARRIAREHFKEWTRKADPEIFDVVLSRRCNPGETGHVPRGLKFALGQNLVLLRSDGRLVVKPFLRWLVRGPQWWEQVSKYINVGAVFDSLKCADIPEFRLGIPPLSEQRTIAHILGTLDDKIELNRQMNETLEAMARALFKDWFVDFGPVRAKAEGRASYLAPELWDLFPDALDNEDKPIGWRIGMLGDCFHLIMGQSPPGSTYNDHGEGMPFFQGRTDFGFRYPKNRKYCTEPVRIAERNDTLVSVRAPVGDINMAWEKCCIGRGVAGLRHKSGARSFSYYSALSIQQELKQYEYVGTVFGAINKRQFEVLNVVDPPPENIEHFETQVGPLDNRIRKNVAENRILMQTRDLLLPKLMSGDIRLAEAEKAAEAVA